MRNCAGCGRAFDAQLEDAGSVEVTISPGTCADLAGVGVAYGAAVCSKACVGKVLGMIGAIVEEQVVLRGDAL